MITLFAKRNGTDVNIYDKDNNLKGIYNNKGYRPTRATKEITLNSWMWKLNWL